MKEKLPDVAMEMQMKKGDELSTLGCLLNDNYVGLRRCSSAGALKEIEDINMKDKVDGNDDLLGEMVENLPPVEFPDIRKDLGIRRCSSTGALNNIKVEERAMVLQHPAILRLKCRRKGQMELQKPVSLPEGHTKFQKQVSLPDGQTQLQKQVSLLEGETKLQKQTSLPLFGSTDKPMPNGTKKISGCLKSPVSSRKRLDSNSSRNYRKDNSLAEFDTGSNCSTTRVNFTGYQLQLDDDLPDDRDLSDEVFIDQKEETPCFVNKYGCPALQGYLRDQFMVILSCLYGILLVVIGLVLPLAETIIYPMYVFEVFYIYLFLVSMLFLLYVYVFLLHEGHIGISRVTSRISLRLSGRKQKISGTSDVEPIDSISNCSRFKRRRIAFDQTSNHHTGSFYLRLGAMSFGIGSMIFDGLYFGQYFDHVHKSSQCKDAMEAIKPALKFLFTFTQLYFIFQNSKMRIFKFPSLARFGLMHMSATNICVWFRVIVVETLHSIEESNQVNEQNPTSPTNGMIQEHSLLGFEQYNMTHIDQLESPTKGHGTHQQDHVIGFGSLPELSCHWSDSIGKILLAATPYLYPFCIEYSLICAAILYVMWQNVGKKENKEDPDYVDEFDESHLKRAHRMSVDCSGSSRGLFLGIFFFVFGVITTIAFYVTTDNSSTNMTDDLIANLSETIIYLFAIFAIVIASIRMRRLRFYSALKDRLEENLILISLTGLYMFGVFNLIPGFYYHDKLEGVLTVITNITMMIEATLQTIFMFASLRMSASHPNHAKKKPGREFVTFLLLCNFTMWGITTFETRSIAHNSLQLQFYGPEAWAIFEHISVPLGIFYRFHSTVCLSHVWKNAWKRKKTVKDKI